ncbi:MAG: ATP synthase F0 subunit C [Candidatus Absconditabacteria bacterium]
MDLANLAPALAIGIAGLGSTIGLGLIGKTWVESIGRNPESAKASFVPAILALALTEAIAIYGFVIAFMLMGKI